MIECEHYDRGRCRLLDALVPEAAGRSLPSSWCKFCQTQVAHPTAESPGPVVAGIVVQLGRQLGRQDLVDRFTPHREVRSPGLLQQAGTAAAAFARFVASGGRRVPPEIQAQRLEHCRRCEYHDRSRCKLCGCYLAAKVVLPLEECPIGRWEAHPMTAKSTLPQPEEDPDAAPRIDLMQALPMPVKRDVRNWAVALAVNQITREKG